MVTLCLGAQAEVSLQHPASARQWCTIVHDGKYSLLAAVLMSRMRTTTGTGSRHTVCVCIALACSVANINSVKRKKKTTHFNWEINKCAWEMNKCMFGRNGHLWEGSVVRRGHLTFKKWMSETGWSRRHLTFVWRSASNQYLELACSHWCSVKFVNTNSKHPVRTAVSVYEDLMSVAKLPLCNPIVTTIERSHTHKNSSSKQKNIFQINNYITNIRFHQFLSSLFHQKYSSYHVRHCASVE